MSVYLVIGPLSVDGMTAQQPDIVAGYPAPTAVAGLGHKFSLDLKAAGIAGARSDGTAVIVHTHSLMAGHVKLPLEDKTKIRQNQGASILDEQRARLTVSLVIALSFDNDVQDADLHRIASEIVPSLYFGGGKVFPAVGKRRAEVLIAKDFGALADAITSVPAGFTLLDRSELLVSEDTTRDPLDVLLDIVEMVPQDTGGGDTRYARRNAGWLVPVFVGYQAIERMRPRRGLRNATAIGHVFAESVYSVGEFRSVRSIISKKPETLASAFWKHTYNPSTETYLVSAAS